MVLVVLLYKSTYSIYIFEHYIYLFYYIIGDVVVNISVYSVYCDLKGIVS